MSHQDQEAAIVTDHDFPNLQCPDFSGGTFFHTRSWLNVLQSTYGFAPLYLYERGRNEIVSLLPMMEIKSWLTSRRGIALPFTDECGPLCRTTAESKRLVDAAIRHAHLHQWKHVEIRGNLAFLPDGSASTTFWGHTLRLEGDIPQLFSRVDPATRRAIRKAEQSRLQVEVSKQLEPLRVFYDLHCETRRRHGLPPQPFRFFSNLHRHVLCRNEGVVIVAYAGTKPVAGAVFLHFRQNAIFKFGASDEAFQRLRPNNLVMWKAIEWHLQNGFKTMDFGRTSTHNAGLRRFKLGWGASERAIAYFRFNPKNSQIVPSRDATRGWYTHLFRVMPEFLSRTIGTAAYKHIA